MGVNILTAGGVETSALTVPLFATAEGQSSKRGIRCGAATTQNAQAKETSGRSMAIGKVWSFGLVTEGR